MKPRWQVPLKARVLIAGILASLPFYAGHEQAPLEALLIFLLAMVPGRVVRGPLRPELGCARLGAPTVAHGPLDVDEKQRCHAVHCVGGH